MSTLPHGVIRVPVDLHTELFLVQEIHWAPLITVIDQHGEQWTIPASNYPQASPGEAAKFWSLLEQAIHERYTNPNSRN